MSLEYHSQRLGIAFFGIRTQNQTRVGLGAGIKFNVSERRLVPEFRHTLKTLPWLPDTSATRHFGIKTLWDTSAPISRHLYTKNVVRDTSTRVPWSRKSRDTSTRDNCDDTQLHRWFVLNFDTNFVVPNCLGAEVSCGRSVRLPLPQCIMVSTISFYVNRYHSTYY